MGLPVEVNNLMLGSLGGYTVGRSLRFRSSATAYLNRTPASAGNQQKWTWSGWVKRGALSYVHPFLFSCYQDDNNRTVIGWYNSDQFAVYNIDAASVNLNLVTTAVYRDPSAWYHIVVAIDTTQATSSNRAIIYINGQQVTALSTATYPSQNTSLYMNSARQHRIASSPESTPKYFDGYIAEVNFIDGQALTPSSFGAYDTNGVWQPKKYSGTYGTNGFYLPFNWSTNTSYAGSFNGSTQYLTVPTNTAFDFGSGNFTIEAWVLTDTTTNRNIVAREYTGNGSNYTGYIFSTTQVVASTSGSGWEVNFTWSLPSANQWHHYALVRNGNVYTVYIDGIAVGTQTVAGTLINGFGGAFTIGYRTGQSLPNGSISNLRVVKGTAVYTSNFTPPTSALTAISGTSLLTLQSSTVIDNSTNAFTITNVGSVAMAASSPFGASVLADASGNNNGWSGNNINYSAYGTTYDSMIDSPTNAAGTSTGIGNYATWNPIFPFGNQTFSNGNLSVATGTTGGAIATISVSSGKWYWEVSPTTIAAGTPRVAGLVQAITAPTSLTSKSIYLQNDGKYSINGAAAVTYGGAITTSDIVGVAVDVDAQTVTFYKNGTAMGSAISISSVYTSGDIIVPAIVQSGGANNAQDINFGQRPFAYTPPSGFKALNTYNLPAPSIANGAQHFAATLYTGNGGTQTISNAVNNVSFQPDFAWMKARNNTYSNLLFDSVRGGTKRLISNDTSGDTTVTGGVNSFNTDGITIQNDASLANLNASATTYVGWQWKGGGTAVTNNSGTISSQVSANTSSGISIITYTGNGTAGATVGHGLGVAPNLVIWKKRSSTANWFVWSKAADVAAGSTRWGYLNATNAFSTSASTNEYPTYKVDPTSTVLTLNGTGSSNGTNDSSATYVAYCFSAVSGYSAFGTYTGNGSADGPFIYTGFRPRFVMIKGSSFVSNWNLNDSSRSSYNLADLTLRPNLSNAEFTSSGSGFALDFLSNGFKLRANYIDSNSSGDTFIYAAFAENPFNISRAR